MSEILNKVRDVDPNNSDAVKEVLSTFFQTLNKHIEGDCKRWLRALENIINRFPKYCGSHRNTIEVYLTHYLDSNDYYNVIAAAKCAHALQQVRPAQDKNATPKACWRDHQLALCNAAHKLVGLLFPNAVDMYRHSGNLQKLQLQYSATSPLCLALDQIYSVPKAQNNNINKQVVLGTRLRNVFVFLQAALTEVYPVPKPVQPQLILEAMVRALSLSSAVKEAEDITKAAAVKIQSLRTIDALVACLGPNLIPFSALIFKFVMLTLTWTSENCDEEGQTTQVRCRAYETLRRWLRTLITCRPEDSARGRGWEDDLISHILADITPARHLVQLTMSSQPTRHLSKKAKRKLANSMLQESSIASHTPGEKNRVQVSAEASDEIAMAALDFAETFLNVCGMFLKPSTHKLLCERVLRSCYTVESQPPVLVLPLLRVARALHAACPGAPPSHHALELFSALATSRDEQVSKFCSQALLELRLHLHCSPPSLNFAALPDVRPIAEKPKKLSSKNRAALESLLGAKNMPKESTEEVIDVDGPSNKRPRLDNVEVSDRISVSSESGSSVEISDESDDDVEIMDVADNVGNQEAQPDEVDSGQTEESQESQYSQGTNEGSYSAAKETNGESDSGGTEDSRSKDASVASKSKVESKDTKTNKDSDSGDTEDSKSRDVSVGTKATDDCDDTSSKDTYNGVESQEGSAESQSRQGIHEVLNETKSASTGVTTEESEESQDIHQATTQMPVNTSCEIADEIQSPRSLEVQISYDFPNTGETRVTIIEKTEDDIPSSTETDDVQINCGQVVKCSQDVDNEKQVENKENERPKVNGDKNPEISDKGTDKLTGAKDVSVEDMLADFVDEINEENVA